MSKAVVSSRFLLGVLMLVFGLNGFFGFIEMPLNERAASVMESFVESGYLMTLVKGTEVLIGVLLVTNVLVPLALATLFSIGVNIIAFHLALGPATILPGLIVFALNLFLIWAYRSHFGPLLEVRTVPDVER